ncbi:uncharacterized protein LOC142351458 isoform X2 [Convolutriloba macropyga]|uniref:uncharacterized protein LOC142351458 isoform X2 n=1 Tax=Convolutriloba macropyga TaxID=536237 RepID=UPI003F51D428
MKSHNSLSWPVIFLSILQCISGTKDAGILKKCSKVAETLKNLNTSMVLEPKNLKDLEKWNKALLDDDCQACAKNIETSVANMCCQTGNSSSCFIVKSEESEKSLNLGPLFEHCKVDGKTNAKGCQVAQQRNKEDLNNAEKNGDTKVEITDGPRVLGSVLGSEEACSDYIGLCETKYLKITQKLTNFAKTECIFLFNQRSSKQSIVSI